MEDFLQGYENLKEAFTRQGIQAEDWYNWHQALSYVSLLTLEDSTAVYGKRDKTISSALS